MFGFLGVAVVELIARWAQQVALETAGQRALLRLRLRVFDHLQKLPTAFFDRTAIGRLVGRVTTDVEALQEMFSSGVVTILGDLVFLIAAVWLLLTLSPSLTAVTMIMVPILLVVTLYVRTRVRVAYTAMRAQLSKLNGFLHEQVSGMSVIQMFGQEAQRTRAFGAVNDGVRDSHLRSVYWESVLSAVTEMLGSFTTALILWYGGGLALEALGAPQADAVSSGLTLGALFAFVDYMQKFFVPLNDLSLKYTVLQNAMVASDRIFELLDEAPEPADRVNSGAIPSDRVSGDSVSGGRGSVTFRNVSFAYRPDTPVLEDVSFEIKAGETVALVGATGSGKSTILSLLTRLYELEHGAIELDGVDVRGIARADLRRRVGVVPQDSFLFHGTILDNVRLGHPGISDAEAIAAADRLHLDEIAARFPGGYHEAIAERGKNLSAGERQLIAFARMLVRAPEVLLLDEATSNVDSHLEHLLTEAVQRLMVGRTALIVAHRLSTVRNADRTLVLHKGRLVESGTHDELLKRRGVYWRLYQLQYAEPER
jgi:ATP-binding cassette subfamily B protein